MNKKLTYILSSIGLSFLASHLYAWKLRSLLRETAIQENENHFEALYQALVLENYSTLTYGILTLGILILIVFIANAPLKKKWTNWLFGIGLGLLFVIIEMIFFASFFKI